MKIIVPTIEREEYGYVSGTRVTYSFSREGSSRTPFDYDLTRLTITTRTIFDTDLQAKRRAIGVGKLAVVGACCVTVFPAMGLVGIVIGYSARAYEALRKELGELGDHMAAAHGGIMDLFSHALDEVRAA